MNLFQVEIVSAAINNQTILLRVIAQLGDEFYSVAECSEMNVIDDIDFLQGKNKFIYKYFYVKSNNHC